MQIFPGFKAMSQAINFTNYFWDKTSKCAMCYIYRVMLIYDYIKVRESAFIRKKPPQKFSALLLEGKQLLHANYKHSMKCSDCKMTLTWSNPALSD